jgi:hypothetical protein
VTNWKEDKKGKTREHFAGSQLEKLTHNDLVKGARQYQECQVRPREINNKSSDGN